MSQNIHMENRIKVPLELPQVCICFRQHPTIGSHLFNYILEYRECQSTLPNKYSFQSQCSIEKIKEKINL